MRNSKLQMVTIILITLFVFATVVTVYITYKDIDNSIAIRLVQGYLILTIGILLYIPVVFIFNLRKYKWYEIKKRLIWFIFLSSVFFIVSLFFNYFIMHSNQSWVKFLIMATSMGLGLSFHDVLLKGKSKEYL